MITAKIYFSNQTVAKFETEKEETLSADKFLKKYFGITHRGKTLRGDKQTD